MRFMRGDVRDHVASQKNDHGTPYRRYDASQPWRRPKINFCEIFDVVRFSTFSTLSAQTGRSNAVTDHECEEMELVRADKRIPKSLSVGQRPDLAQSGHSAKRQGRLSTMGSHRRPRGRRIFLQAPERGKNHAARMRPSCCKAVTPSSRPISSRIFPSLSFNAVVPVDPAGGDEGKDGC